VDPVPPAPVARRLDRKPTAILDGRYTPDDVVIPDADTAFGVAAAGPAPARPGTTARAATTSTRCAP
jgi:hypothetical protein